MPQPAPKLEWRTPSPLATDASASLPVAISAGPVGDLQRLIEARLQERLSGAETAAPVDAMLRAGSRALGWTALVGAVVAVAIWLF